MMEFKEWLKLDEIRYKGFARQFRQQNPDMPKYVQDDLYNSRIGYALGRTIDAKSGGAETQRPTQTPMSDVPQLSPEQAEMMRKKWASMKPSDILSKQNFSGDKWGDEPEVITVTPANFTEKTQWYFLDRRFGFREEKQIRNDAQRTALQRQMMNYKPEGENEPVIIRKTPQGFELLEGWHRTMSLLLKGAPPDQLELLRSGNGYHQDISFSNWKPVQIKAFVSLSKETQASMAGTGEYIPSSGSGYNLSA